MLAAGLAWAAPAFADGSADVIPPPPADTGPAVPEPPSPYQVPEAEGPNRRSAPRGFRDARNRDGAPTAVVVGFTFGSSDWADTPFRQRDTSLRLQGEELELGRLDFTGFDAVFHYLGRPPWIVGAGMTYGTPFGGGGRRVEVLGPRARIDRVHLFRWYAEAGARALFGDLELFAMLHLGAQRAMVEVSGPDRLLIASRVAAGPRAGLRARLYRTLYVHASVFTDVLVWPGSLVTLGLALGPTGRLLRVR